MSGATDQRERELKFDVPDNWELPEPAALVPPGGALERDLVHLESTYFDTSEHGLLRSGLTLRRRAGDTDTGWHLKVPAGNARTEIRLPLDGRDVPAELQEITRGARGGADLRQVARLATERAVFRLQAADHSGLVEIAVDTVTATTTRFAGRDGAGPDAVAGPDDDAAGRHAAGDVAEVQRWREVEIELLGGDEQLLQRAAKWLRHTGARPAATGSKLARALADSTGPRAGRACDKLREDGLGRLVATYLDAQWDAILLGDIALRRGQDAIHATRVGTRRYRSVLRVFRDLVDPDRATWLDTELRWYAGALGELRDRQVMRAHLDGQLAALPPELVLGPVAARIDSTLDAELAAARRELTAVMRSERYFALLHELRSWHESLPLRRDPRAKRVHRYLGHSEHAVDKRLARARKASTGEERDLAMHRSRKAAKRARYTAELAEPYVPAAAATVGRMKQLQNELGDRQDGVVIAEFLRRLGAAAGTTPGENGFTFGVLFEQERERTRRADAQAGGDR